MRSRERDSERMRSEDRDRGRRRDSDRRDSDRDRRGSSRERDRDDRHRSQVRLSSALASAEASYRPLTLPVLQRSCDRDHDRDRDRGRGDRDRGERERDRRDEGERRGSRERERGGRYDGGYQPRRRSNRERSPEIIKHVDPFAHLRAANAAQGIAPATRADAKVALVEQQQKARQLVLQQQATSAAAAASKTQREVYVGNLMSGKVTEPALRQLFDAALTTAFPHIAAGHPPVTAVSLHSEGRYAFVELASSEMATASLQLSGQLDFLGSQITVGRPSGYIDPAKAMAAAAAANKALQEYGADGKLREAGDEAEVLARGDAPPAVEGPTNCVAVDGMVRERIFSQEDEYQVRGVVGWGLDARVTGRGRGCGGGLAQKTAQRLGSVSVPAQIAHLRT